MTESTNSRAVATREPGAVIEQVVMKGDLAALAPEERVAYYREVCESLNLNPLTKPFEYINLDGKLTLYARRDATDQLRNLRQVSVTIVARERVEDVYIVTARATLPDGRTDESTGVVPLAKEDGEWLSSQNGKRYFKGNGNYIPLHGDALANALMKAETKAKRRVTLSIVGLGWLDESELETIPSVRVVDPPAETPRPVPPQPQPRPQPAPSAPRPTDRPAAQPQPAPAPVSPKAQTWASLAAKAPKPTAEVVVEGQTMKVPESFDSLSLDELGHYRNCLNAIWAAKTVAEIEAGWAKVEQLDFDGDIGQPVITQLGLVAATKLRALTQPKQEAHS